ncbi:helicase with zinc finger domain 2 [Bombina bombina]|uniref:helicase with zinc finger domain 2 n=1 Tax=Bombina bombina TaxID=8345 RepID=UPI00235AFCDE|nr:helicase with zinc finger domain 2 [Bombina bombina]
MGQPREPPACDLIQLKEEVELVLACHTCCQKKYHITYTWTPSTHTCAAKIFLGRLKKDRTGKEWHEVRQRPVFPVPARYEVCWHYQHQMGCTKHQQHCTFAWSHEERIVWSFEKRHNLQQNKLISLLFPNHSKPIAPQLPISWESILEEFGGQFQEVCEQCFYLSPPKITGVCQSHPRFMPLLVHIVINGTQKQCNAIRPLSGTQNILLCNQPSRGILCRGSGRHCPNAHSEVELAVWKAEKDSVLSRGNIPVNRNLNMGFYCRLCLVTASSQESFEVHCSSLEHRRMMTDDSLTVWNHRAPQLNVNCFSVCESPLQCVHGTGCPKAHSQEELQEWILRAKVSKWNKQVMEEEGLQSYQERLVQEFQLCSGDITVFSDALEGVEVECDYPLRVHSKEKNVKKTWNFTVKTKMPLSRVALLKSEPGATFSLLAPHLTLPCSYAEGSKFKIKSSFHFKVGVQVIGSVFGVFEQWLILDFGIRPVLVQKIFLQVGGPDNVASPQNEPSEGESSQIPSTDHWYSGKYLIIPCVIKTEEEEHLMSLYKPPTPKQQHLSAFKCHLTVQNYRQQMHMALLQEEAARENVISRLNMNVSVTLCTKVIYSQEMKFSPPGELLAEVPLPSGVTPDTEEGYLLYRSVRTALLALYPMQGDKVYQVHVDASIGPESSILLQLPERCCQEMLLKPDTSYQLQIKFQLDRLQFCKYHEAVDRLLDENLVLPDLPKCHPPKNQKPPSWGNEKQKLASAYITGPVEAQVPPLLIYGPFGTGKTYTMAKATLEVIKQPGTRVLICTHNNSAADLYIREYFHTYVMFGHPEAIPLRVKYSYSPLNRTDAVTLQYCYLNEDCSSFLIPTRKILDQHRIIVTTAETARDLDVPRGFFSHILLDEAAQMLESEALIPLALANHCTRIIVAGDHMQETAKLFCGEASTAGEKHTLLTRLFSNYQSKDCPAAKSGRIIFNQNYRSAPAIISFVSRCFYVGRGDAIEACAGATAAPPPNQHTLGLCHVHGPSTRDGSSWVNHPEALQVLEVVKEVIHQWPEKWGALKHSSICVVSHGSQVKLIRQELRSKKLSAVTVTNYENILGGQFRVVVVSTVRSIDSLPPIPPTSSSFSLDIFCDPRVLNTVLTRARSQVVVVGDMVALCSFGGCSRIWKRYVRECVEAGSATPHGLSVEEIKQAVCDYQIWNEPLEEDKEEEEYNDFWTSDPDINAEDSILQELLDNKRMTCVTVSEEGMLGITAEQASGPKSELYTDFSINILEEYLLKQPHVYKRCHLIKENFDRGYAVTLDDSPPRRIQINGRINSGLAFSGDEVLVKLIADSKPDAGTVVGVFKAGEENRRFVCYMDPHDHNIMIPIDHSITKVFCPMHKNKPGMVPIRNFRNGNIQTLKFEKLTLKMKQDHVFLVKVICWRQNFYYPLGIITRIIPKVSTLEEGLNILDLEYKVADAMKYPVKAVEEVKKLMQNIHQEEGRQDFRDIITFTVDPSGAKDLDDAISVREFENHYEIGVHITDLVSLVPLGSELDNEARKRAVTFYPPKREAAHMLPGQLSTDMCSLKPQCDRPVISLLVMVEKETDMIVKGHFCRAIIRSDCQLTYEQAYSILCAKRGHPMAFSNVEECVAVVAHFSRAHRFCRLQEASTYDQLNEDCLPGTRGAHQMIAEVMIMYNSWVAEFLTSKEQLVHLVPVRCQAQPSLDIIEQLRNKFSHVLPLSNYLSHHLLDISEVPSPSSRPSVTMLTSVWEQLQIGAERQDYDCIIDILSTDDLHPELCQATREFRRQLGRASFRRSSTPDATSHYSLELCPYTWASSPIRRYLDIVVQRLLFATFKDIPPQVSARDIDLLCLYFDRKVQQEKNYEKKAYSLQLAMELQSEVQHKLAVVFSIIPNSRNFQVVFPMNSDSLPDTVSLEYSALQPEGQPEFISGGTYLSWRRRVYSFNNFRDKPLSQNVRKDITIFSATAWQEAVRAANQGEAMQVLKTLKDGVVAPEPSYVQQSMCGHFIEFSLTLHPGDSIPVQLCTALYRGFPAPVPQLCTPVPGIQLCLEHTERPVNCFSSLAHRAPLQTYKNLQDYQKVWFPLCAIEAVVAAVNEGGTVILRDVPVEWGKRDQVKETVGQGGYFNLSPLHMKECDLEMDFRHCYICLRLEGLKEHISETQPRSNTYTWVAHGLTKIKNHVTAEEGGEVSFSLHQGTMKHIPEEVFNTSARFTVEIIPKLLPDIRREIALHELLKASELCKNIIVGKRIPDEVPNRSLRSQNCFDIPGFGKLNPSQTKAVKTALAQPFTLIQGPPGTGKTVVGVHVVYWFHKMNANLQEEEEKEETEETEEKSSGRRVIMYCGPSNKSVDVVAEKLLPLRTQLRPLRIYSEQMELSEFPYPGSSRRISGYLREGKPNSDLRPITLHHLIRAPSNPYHRKILEMDNRIRNNEELTLDEVLEYKKLIFDARAVELGRHDIILCTCITASNAALVRLHVSQLVIDECGMCTEPETLVPLTSHKQVKSVVLIGDHRQLRPVVLHEQCRILKMDRSLFERYQERALMLNIQYRMARLVKRLIQAGVAAADIAVLTPYNAQVSEITKMLQEQGIGGATVCTIMKSQGSEWRYVILSTVRSISMQELDSRPTHSWLKLHLGFLADPNQTNVALTRAKEGLCVLGNSNLLKCCALWRRLLDHYSKRHAIVHSTRIEVATYRRTRDQP